jgi:hypothetical protein
MTAMRRVGPVVLALVFAIGLVASPPVASDVRAATPDLTIVTDATYNVRPDDRVVRVTVDMRLRNNLRDTATRRYYFDTAFLAVLPGTSRFRVSGPGSPSVRATRENDDYTLLRINLGRRLFSKKSANYRLTFDLKDQGGSSTRDVRVGDSLASFPVWAYASDDTPGSRVSVVFPKGYTIDVEVGDLPAPTTDEEGRSVYKTGKLDKPLDFFAYFVADRPGAYDENEISTTVANAPVGVTVRSWAEDDAWGKRIGGLFEEGLPQLSERIGLPWPREEGLVVQESVSRSTGGYAGLFDPTRGHVEVAYYADDFVVLHEAAHTWFNGNLLADRWALEAFASYYALEAASDLKVKAKGDELTDELREAKIPLNAWGPIGREDTDTEDYAYAATLEVARQIAERAGEEGLQEVWQAAADNAGAYQPTDDAAATGGGTSGGGGTPAAAEPERVLGPPDWRGLLDLLEDHTDANYEDIWREWIVRPDDVAQLDARATAREQYDSVVEEAAAWTLPRPIRDAMRAWQFDTATGLLGEAAVVLEQRDAIDLAAADAGLTPPDSLRAAFEGDDGFDDARAEIEDQLEVIDRYADAVATKPSNPDVFAQLGLWQETPEKELTTAATAYAAGDLDKSAAAADDARLTWIGAAGVGRTRALMILGAVIGVVLLIALAILTLIRVRRGRRPTTEVAPAGAAAAPPGAAPSASALTTATDPDPTEVVPRIDSTTPEPPG